jgi:hypothetical protein
MGFRCYRNAVSPGVAPKKSRGLCGVETTDGEFPYDRQPDMSRPVQPGRHLLSPLEFPEP